MTDEVVNRYRPRGSAAQLLLRREPEVLVAGPAGTGKSRAALFKLHQVMRLNPNARGLMVRKTSVSLTSTALVTYRQHVAVDSIASGDVTWYGGSPQEAAQYRYANGSTITIGGMDRASKIMSSEYDIAYVQEATELTLEDWEMITTRLRNGVVSFQQLLADCNPGPPTHWLKQRVDAGQTVMLTSRHSENPVLVNDDGSYTDRGRQYMGVLDRLTGVRRLRLRDGLWVAAEGVIYDTWSEREHLVDPFPVPPEWPRWWVVDFGYTNPFVLQRWAEDPDGRLVLYGEQYMTERTVVRHAHDLMAIVSRPVDGYVHPEGRPRYAHHGREWIEPRPRAIICDHDAEGREQLHRELGIDTRPAHKAVAEGIQAVQARLALAGDGKPRMTIMRGALAERDTSLVDRLLPTCTAEEVAGYVWDSTAGKPPKEVPVKENDHGMDAVRYLAADRDLTPGPQLRVMKLRRR